MAVTSILGMKFINPRPVAETMVTHFHPRTYL